MFDDELSNIAHTRNMCSREIHWMSTGDGYIDTTTFFLNPLDFGDETPTVNCERRHSMPHPPNLTFLR